MYKSIIIPVDLEHQNQLDRAVAVAADLAKHYGATLTMVGVTGTAPSAIGHSPKEYAAALQSFARQCGDEHRVPVLPHPAASQDPRADLAAVLNEAIIELRADLVVMASHVPVFADHLFGSNAGHLATQTDRSILIVR